MNFKANQEQIAKNLCIQREMKVNKCNGHCYLSKQLKKAAEKEKKEAESIKEKQEIVYLNTIQDNSLVYFPLMEKTRILISQTCEKPKSMPLGIFRPPLV
jgi:sulfur transfer protein SufE